MWDRPARSSVWGQARPRQANDVRRRPFDMQKNGLHRSFYRGVRIQMWREGETPSKADLVFKDWERGIGFQAERFHAVFLLKEGWEEEICVWVQRGRGEEEWPRYPWQIYYVPVSFQGFSVSLSTREEANAIVNECLEVKSKLNEDLKYITFFFILAFLKHIGAGCHPFCPGLITLRSTGLYVSFLFFVFLQNASPNCNKGLSIELEREDSHCPKRDALLHLSSHRVFFGGGCSNTVPKRCSLPMQCGNTADISLLKIVLSIAMHRYCSLSVSSRSTPEDEVCS